MVSPHQDVFLDLGAPVVSGHGAVDALGSILVTSDMLMMTVISHG